MKNKTTVTKTADIKREWHLIDLSQQTLGRVSTKIATILIGKHKPGYMAHIDDGDYVVAINASAIKVTGKKMRDKKYYHYTGYAGNLKELSLKELMAKDPTLAIKNAVYGMIPKNRLRDKRILRLKIYKDGVHPYADKFKS